tara:strand:+ start:271 stop:1038 length:768 start_codon:yes stop_codon:yes gene_type:complete
MSTFIKAGLWVNKKLGFKGELNLDQLIVSLIPPVTPNLQEVLDAGSTANFTNESDVILIETNASVLGVDKGSAFVFRADLAILSNYKDDNVIQLIADAYGNTIASRNDQSGNTTSIGIDAPTAYGGRINFPDVAGATKTVAMTDDVPAALPYNVYSALLTQSGTSAPVATVLENTFANTIIWSYDITGVYNATLNGAFLPNKTAVFCTKQMTGSGGLVMSGSRTNNNIVSIRVSNATTNVDGELSDASIEIRVYN